MGNICSPCFSDHLPNDINSIPNSIKSHQQINIKMLTKFNSIYRTIEKTADGLKKFSKYCASIIQDDLTESSYNASLIEKKACYYLIAQTLLKKLVIDRNLCKIQARHLNKMSASKKRLVILPKKYSRVYERIHKSLTELQSNVYDIKRSYKLEIIDGNSGNCFLSPRKQESCRNREPQEKVQDICGIIIEAKQRNCCKDCIRQTDYPKAHQCSSKDIAQRNFIEKNQKKTGNFLEDVELESKKGIFINFSNFLINNQDLSNQDSAKSKFLQKYF